MHANSNVTRHLGDVKNGNEEAYGLVYELVYDDLKKIAKSRLHEFKRGDTLDTTSLVHESYLKLMSAGQSDWTDRAHFYAVASRAMRFILVDYIRSKTAKKRGDGRDVEMLDEEAVSTEQRLEEFISLNMALEKLMEWNERLGKLVEYRFIGGMSYEEISEVTGLSEPTLKRDWVRARTWLYNTMKEMQGLK